MPAMLRPSTPQAFAATCPKGHRPAQTLSAAEVVRPAVTFYCVLCDRCWIPTTQEREEALHAIVAREAWPQATSSPVDVVAFQCRNCECKTHVHCQRLDFHGEWDGGIVECLDCGYVNRPTLSGPVLDVFRA